eukprot:7572230-Pyramimonas_sp.AAC.1
MSQCNSARPGAVSHFAAVRARAPAACCGARRSAVVARVRVALGSAAAGQVSWPANRAETLTDG